MRSSLKTKPAFGWSETPVLGLLGRVSEPNVSLVVLGICSVCCVLKGGTFCEQQWMNGNSWAGELYQQHSLVCVRKGGRERERLREGGRGRVRRSCNQSSLWALSPTSSLLSSLSLRRWPLFSFLPSFNPRFALWNPPHTHTPPHPFGNLCRLSWLAGCHCKGRREAREEEKRRKKREIEKPRQIDNTATGEGQQEGRTRGGSSVSLSTPRF